MADDAQNTVQATEESIAEAPAAEPASKAAEVFEKSEDAVQEKRRSSKAVPGNLEQIIEKIERLSVLELSDLVHTLEDRFGVSAAPSVAVAAGAATPQAGAQEGPGEEQTIFNVIMTSAGANRIGAIKAVRELVPTLGLKEAKDLVEAAPKPVLEGVNKETANEAKTKLTAAGATVELQ